MTSHNTAPTAHDGGPAAQDGTGRVRPPFQPGASTMAAALLLAATPTDRALAGWQPRESVPELFTRPGSGEGPYDRGAR